MQIKRDNFTTRSVKTDLAKNRRPAIKLFIRSDSRQNRCFVTSARRSNVKSSKADTSKGYKYKRSSCYHGKYTITYIVPKKKK